MKKEYKLIMLSVLKNRTKEEDAELYGLFQENLDWEIILSQLLRHRLAGYFLSNITPDQKKKMIHEPLKTLQLLIKAQAKQSLDMVEVVKPVLKDLENEQVRYAGLKGIIFNVTLYKPGDRRSNDTDLMVIEDDLEKLDGVLRRHGYIQTFLKDGEYKEATRKEKLIQRMNHHDLVPYVKLVDQEFVKFHEIDINFHFDSKDINVTKKAFEHGLDKYENDLYSVKGFPWELNLGYLCVHFYREGTNSIWTSEKRDVSLYKLVDIINTLRNYDDKEKISKWPELMREFNIEKAAYYTLHMLSQFYTDEKAEQLMAEIKLEDTSFVDEIYLVNEKRTIKRTESFLDSAFNLKG